MLLTALYFLVAPVLAVQIDVDSKMSEDGHCSCQASVDTASPSSSPSALETEVRQLRQEIDLLKQTLKDLSLGMW